MKKLFNIIPKLREPQDISKFLIGLFTEKELKEIERRLMIIELLIQGLPHHQIAKELNVGVATVTRGSKELQKGNFEILRNIQKYE